MNSTSFLEHPDLQHIIKQHISSKEDVNDASYNLLSLSSYNCHFENFHSDIIASLLNPTERHKEGRLFLGLFAKWLKGSYAIDIEPADFTDSVVTREQGKIDIWIRDRVSKKSIIIENKMNNAVDMDEQLDRYYAHAETRSFNTACVIYLTLNGAKVAPPSESIPIGLVYNIAAFTGNPTDLVNGWLLPCYEASKVNGNDSTSSFIYQYIQLLKYLSQKTMNNDSMEQFYQFVSNKGGTDTLKSIVEMESKLTLYRADKFAGSIQNYAPFKKHGRWRPDYLCYERYQLGEHQIKMDVFFEEDKSPMIVLWNTQVGHEEGMKIVSEKLSQAGFLDKFEIDPTMFNHTAHKKHFKIGSVDYPTMAVADAEHISFAQQLLAALKAL